MSALTRFFAGAIHGRTHRSAPTQCRKRSGTNGKWSGTVPLRGGTKPAPYRCTTVGSSERADVDIGPSAAEAAWRSGGWLGPARRRGSGTPDRRALRGKVQEGMPLPGFRRLRRKESKSFFAAACTWRKILLRPQVWKMAAPMGRPFYARSRPALSFAQGSSAVLGEEISR